MNNILRILENQKEVKHLTYFISKNRMDVIILKLGVMDLDKKYKFKDESACLNKLVDILFDLKKKESWMIKKMEKNK